jgi:dCMP deaminase
MVDYYMDVAKRTAQLSYAEKLKVGAILVKDDMIVSHSWNGTPRGWDNICEIVLENGELKTKPEVTHAEEAMLMKVASNHQSTEGGILFCTHSCCMNCAKLIYGAKIKEFYYREEYRSSDGLDFLRNCNIPVYKV